MTAIETWSTLECAIVILVYSGVGMGLAVVASMSKQDSTGKPLGVGGLFMVGLLWPVFVIATTVAWLALKVFDR